jgi:phage terminase small subunit
MTPATRIREERFAREYVIDLNGSEAAKRAGYAERSARITASRLLTKANVKDLIAKLTKEKFEKLEISADWVLGELRKLAGYDAGAIFNDDGSLKPIREWDPATRTALVGLDHEKLFEHFGGGQAKHVGTTRKIKLADKLRALELLGRHLKLFTDRVEVSGMDGLAEKLNQIRKRKHGDPRD